MLPSHVLQFIQENITILLTAAVVLMFGIHQWLKRPPNFPPGPIGLPILGIGHKLANPRSDLELTVSYLVWVKSRFMKS